VYAIDEVHLLECDLLTHLWGDSKERLQIPIINEKKTAKLIKVYSGSWIVKVEPWPETLSTVTSPPII